MAHTTTQEPPTLSSKPKPPNPVEVEFNRRFQQWRDQRPDSLELDALKVIAWEFYQRGQADGMLAVANDVGILLSRINQHREGAGLGYM